MRKKRQQTKKEIGYQILIKTELMRRRKYTSAT